MSALAGCGWQSTTAGNTDNVCRPGIAGWWITPSNSVPCLSLLGKNTRCSKSVLHLALGLLDSQACWAGVQDLV